LVHINDILFKYMVYIAGFLVKLIGLGLDIKHFTLTIAVM